MSNPFEYFANDEEDQPYHPVNTEHKPKRTHAEKRAYKQQQENKKSQQSSPLIQTQSIPPRQKQNAKQIRNPRHPPTPLTKKLGEGHYHDRRSGTGRVDKPRKAGGGKGNVGNVKDDLNQEKYVQQGTQENAPVVTENENQNPPEQGQQEPKAQQPQALTLEEYYKNKGIDVSNTFEKKELPKKNEINAEIKAEWIKKQKLTVMQTKQDKRQGEKKPQNSVKASDARGELDQNLGALGFNSKPKGQQIEKKDSKSQHRGKGGKGRKQKVVLNEEDFPSL